MRGLASSLARGGRSARSPQQAAPLVAHGGAPAAVRLSQSAGSLAPASRLAARRTMSLHNVSTRRPAQVSPHRAQKKLCGDAPSPHAVAIRCPRPPAATTSAYSADPPPATSDAIDLSLNAQGSPAAPEQDASADRAEAPRSTHQLRPRSPGNDPAGRPRAPLVQTRLQCAGRNISMGRREDGAIPG